MRGALYLLGFVLVVAAAFGSYRTSYQTHDLADATAKLRREIAREREALAVLKAEWAYLNAPERLQRLVSSHQTVLALAPMTGDRYADLAEIAEPAPDDGMEPVTIIGLDDLTPNIGVAPSPRPRPVGLGRP